MYSKYGEFFHAEEVIKSIDKNNDDTCVVFKPNCFNNGILLIKKSILDRLGQLNLETGFNIEIFPQESKRIVSIGNGKNSYFSFFNHVFFGDRSIINLENYYAFVVSQNCPDTEYVSTKIEEANKKSSTKNCPKFNVGDMVVRKDCIKTEIHQVTSVYEVESLDNKFYYRLDGFMGNIIFPESGLSKIKLLDSCSKK